MTNKDNIYIAELWGSSSILKFNGLDSAWNIIASPPKHKSQDPWVVAVYTICPEQVGKGRWVREINAEGTIYCHINILAVHVSWGP